MKIKVWVCTKYYNSKDERQVDIEEDLGYNLEDWKDISEIKKDDIIKNYIEDNYMYEWGWYEK